MTNFWAKCLNNFNMVNIHPKSGNSRNQEGRGQMANQRDEEQLRKKINLCHVNQRTKWKIPCLTQEYSKLKLDCANEVKAAVKRFEKNIAEESENGLFVR